MAVGVVDFLKEKNMLVIGGTGFLGKVFIEKILRVQPEVGQIFVLVRAKDLQSAQAKIQKEMICSELFRLLQDRYKGEYEKFMAQKLIPVMGDVSTDDDLGIQGDQRDEVCSKVDIVVNLAATTKFYERYDVSMGVNVVGAINTIKFCRKCPNLLILIHVSTAYVNVGRTGIIAEEAVKIGAEGHTFGADDIKSEVDLIAKTLEETMSVPRDSGQKAESKRMKELGEERARKFGWPNVYVFTKALGEIMVNQMRGDMPIVILRPSIIESTLAEPFPGWMEGNRMLDPLFTGYGKGRIKTFVARKNLIIDVVPADMVANCMITSIYKHVKESNLFIYQVATSVENPLFYDIGVIAAYKYFLSHPCTTMKGKIVKVKRPFLLRSMQSFQQYMKLHYKIPIEMLYYVNLLLCGLQRQQYKQLLHKYNMVMKLATLYQPFIFFQGNYTSFSELLPLIAAARLPFVKIGKICQSINTDKFTVENSASYIGPFATFSVRALASFEVRSPKRIQVKFEEGIIPPPEITSTLDIPENIEIFGQKINLVSLQGSLHPLQEAVTRISQVISGQSPLKIPIRRDGAQSWLLTTYLDEDLRISRGDGGGLFVLVKEGSSLLNL